MVSVLISVTPCMNACKVLFITDIFIFFLILDFCVDEVILTRKEPDFFFF